MKRKSLVLATVTLLAAAGAAHAAEGPEPLVVTASNGVDNQLLVFDLSGALVQSVPTLGQGGAGSNSGGVAASGALTAVVKTLT